MHTCKKITFLNCRIKVFKNFLRILFPERFRKPADFLTISDDTPYLQHWEENIQKMCDLVKSNKLLDVEQDNRGFVNVFSGQVATPEQSVDMMTF